MGHRKAQPGARGPGTALAYALRDDAQRGAEGHHEQACLLVWAPVGKEWSPGASSGHDEGEDTERAAGQDARASRRRSRIEHWRRIAWGRRHYWQSLLITEIT